jgi:hypothetical protein
MRVSRSISDNRNPGDAVTARVKAAVAARMKSAVADLYERHGLPRDFTPPVHTANPEMRIRGVPERPLRYYERLSMSQNFTG